MTSSDSTTTPTLSNPAPVALEHPLMRLFEILDLEQATLRGISGRIRHENNDLFFYPDKAGFESLAYQDDVARVGFAWPRWTLGSDIQTLVELARAVDQPFLVTIEPILPDDADIAPFVQWVEQTLASMGFGAGEGLVGQPSSFNI